MKRFIISIVMVVFSGICLAQDYYSGKSIVSAGEITYKITQSNSYGCCLDNANGVFAYQEQMFEDGTEYVPSETPVYSICQNSEIIDGIVKKNIPSTVLSRMKETNGVLLIGAKFSPKKCAEPEIGYSLGTFGGSISGVYSIPPTSLAAIEKELREKLVFKCSRKDLNYIDIVVYTSAASGNCASLHDDE